MSNIKRHGWLVQEPGPAFRQAVLQRHGLVLSIAGVAEHVLERLLTVDYVLNLADDSGCTIKPTASYLVHSTCASSSVAGAGVGNGMAPQLLVNVGLEPAVRQLLREAGYQIECPPATAPLPAPSPTMWQTHGPFDEALLELVRHSDRGIIQCGAGVDPARLVGQIACAWPEHTIVVAAARQAEVRQLRRGLQQWLPASDLTTIVHGHDYAERRRVAIATYQGLGSFCVGLASRSIFIALNAAEVISENGLLGLEEARHARMYGLLPTESRLAQRDLDHVRRIFGFEEVEIPRHGHRRVPVDVVWCRTVGGPQLPTSADPFEAKQFGVWRHPVRNRRIAALAAALRAPGREQLAALFPTIAPVVQGRNDPRVVILVENLEHAVSLLHHLPDWPLIAAPDLYTADLPRHAMRVLAQTTAVGTPHDQQIRMTAAGAPDLADVDVLIRADAGPGLPAGLQPTSTIQHGADHRVLLIDFLDGHHRQLRTWSRQRQEAYRDSGWYSPGADPVEERVRAWLASRPEVAP